MEGRTVGWKDGRMEGRMDGRTDGQTEQPYFIGPFSKARGSIKHVNKKQILYFLFIKPPSYKCHYQLNTASEKREVK